MSYRRGQIEIRDVRNQKTGLLGSVSTEGSSSEREISLARKKPANKEKLELCRKFMQNGACPYNSKCKFAHGSHQLRRNQSVNIRYKTKQCGTFFKFGACVYGDRCNFLHTLTLNSPNQLHQKLIWDNFRSLFYQLRSNSRLLNLLQKAI